MLDIIYKFSLQEVFSLRYLNKYNPELSIKITKRNSSSIMLCRLVADSSF